MNFAVAMPQPVISVSRPVKVSTHGNVYKIPVMHKSEDGKTVNNYEIWATKEAVQQHFTGMTETPREYQLRKFARQTMEKQLRSTSGNMEHKGILVTTDAISHGNPKLWPHTISHPEVKL
jgi:hypothetical protein